MANTLIDRLFTRRRPRLNEPTDYRSLPQLRGDGLEAEYQRLIAQQLKRWGVGDDCVSIEVRALGPAVDGRDVFIALVRLHGWERKPALRLLLGLPMLEQKVRQAMAALWLGEVSHFGGLWLHASGQLQSTPAIQELRQLVVNLTGPRAQAGLRAERPDVTRPARL